MLRAETFSDIVTLRTQWAVANARRSDRGSVSPVTHVTLFRLTRSNIPPYLPIALTILNSGFQTFL